MTRGVPLPAHGHGQGALGGNRAVPEGVAAEGSQCLTDVNG